jgi:hypothetical protein
VQTELHRHLDLSLRLSTFHRLLRERGLIPAEETLEELDRRVVLRKPLG